MSETAKWRTAVGPAIYEKASEVLLDEREVLAKLNSLEASLAEAQEQRYLPFSCPLCGRARLLYNPSTDLAHCEKCEAEGDTLSLDPAGFDLQQQLAEAQADAKDGWLAAKYQLSLTELAERQLAEVEADRDRLMRHWTETVAVLAELESFKRELERRQAT